jgi:YesN/AraC family two-component response regulator
MPSLLPEEVLKTLEDISADKICTLPEDVGKTVISIMDALNRSQNSNHGYTPKLISSLLQHLIDIFLYHYQTHPTSKRISPENIIQNALIYINSNYTSAITLADIASHANCNPTYLSEYFHKKMDVTIKQYITILRIKRAKKLLTSSNESIMNICFESGFSSLASFNRNFLEIENVSPSAYRKSYNTKNQSPKT